ncbi:peptidase U32 family protein [Oscillibacter valericigenes Sjm18-20]|nr:peptidase U32 family protein [Oscillibacter valericigenes Sjm18-20]
MRPELLSPAGSPESLHSAVECGADAVYLGWGSFNARQSAKNFSDEEFSGALAYCHERGVKVYLTLNTLVADRELDAALQCAKTASALGVDAVLVQDLGLFDLMRRVLPDLPLHASTQMSLFTSGGACEAAADGCRRVVIARECSREDTARICKNCPAEIEVFVHGALCMCYSGQCAMSALIGGRSGNRGRCAQPCRLPYTLTELPGDGGVRQAAPPPLLGKPGKSNYPLSLKDNCLAGELEDMARMGVACLKLEGRMKRPEYVAVVTGIYAWLLRDRRGPTAEESAALEAAFSRSGFTDGYWKGMAGPALLGVRPADASEPKELFAQAKAAVDKGGMRTVPVTMEAVFRKNVPCALTVRDEDGHEAAVSGSVSETARNRAVTAEELESRLKKTGGTAYCCETVSVTADGDIFLPAAAVNALRRDGLAALSALRTAPPVRRVLPVPPPPEAQGESGEPELTCSLARANQLTPELLDCGPARIYLPLELFESLNALPEFSGEYCAALPRVWRDRDETRLSALLSRATALGVSAATVGNLGHLPLLRGKGFSLYGDFGLNVFNGQALAYLAGKGLKSAALSFELRGAQVRDLPKILPAEAIVYGRLPLMITENCLVRNGAGCACERPHALVDRTGAAFPLLSVWGHRTEVENCKPLYLGDRDDWKRLGLRYARLRFTTESPEECARIFRAYQSGGSVPAEFTRGLFDRGVE